MEGSKSLFGPKSPQTVSELDFLADIELLIARVPSPLGYDDLKAFLITLDDVRHYADLKLKPFHHLKINVK